MTFLGDVGARARGLATHLLAEEAFEELARARDRTTFASALEERGYPVAEGGAAEGALASVDAAIARGGARRLAVLARWLGARSAGFAGVFEAADRSLLRILLRGASAGTLPDGLPSGVEPTPVHPSRSLAALAGARDPADLVRRLERAASPYAPALARALEAPGADLLALESALDRAFAERARRGARRVGGRLRGWVAEEIDHENAWHALLGGTGSFVEGGRVLTAARHDAVLREPDAASRRRRLAAFFADAPTGPVFADPEVGLAALEARALEARIAAERRRARREPLGAAPILEYVLRLRAELAGLRRLHWGIAQGVAAAALLAPARTGAPEAAP